MATKGDQYDTLTGNIWDFANRCAEQRAHGAPRARPWCCGRPPTNPVSSHALSTRARVLPGRAAWCPRGDEAGVKLALARGVDVNLQNKVGWTAVHAAARGGQVRGRQLQARAQGATRAHALRSLDLRAEGAPVPATTQLSAHTVSGTGALPRPARRPR